MLLLIPVIIYNLFINIVVFAAVIIVVIIIIATSSTVNIIWWCHCKNRHMYIY